MNRIIDTDSYKASHWLQYPPNTTSVFSYLESRGSATDWEKTVFFGLQYLLKKYLLPEFTKEMVDEAAELIPKHGLPFNSEGWYRLIEKHKGTLPLKIRAVPEGTPVPLKNVLMTVENTDPEFFWLPGWFETQLMRIWYPCTVATLSYHIKKDVKHFLELTSDDPEGGLPFAIHDFGSRGVSSAETAAIGGAAHLVNFMGSDTMSALVLLREFYGEEVAGFSIPAAEHSTMTAWGRDGETEAYANMLNQFASKDSLVAVVSDSWDIYHAVDKIWGETLRDQVINSGARVIIRPDSGDPVEVVSKLLAMLDGKFGSTVNSKGFRLLNHVRVIQGDGVNPKTIREIMQRTSDEGYSIDNIAFGIGGSLLQKVNRDTLKFAYKCSSVTVGGEQRDVYKDPVTDPGKTSKKGRLDLVNQEGHFESIRTDSPNEKSAMRTVFENGNLLIDDQLSSIRERAKI